MKTTILRPDTCKGKLLELPCFAKVPIAYACIFSVS